MADFMDVVKLVNVTFRSQKTYKKKKKEGDSRVQKTHKLYFGENKHERNLDTVLSEAFKRAIRALFHTDLMGKITEEGNFERYLFAHFLKLRYVKTLR